MHVETVAEGVVYEVIAAPQEQPDQAQEERCENPVQGASDPSSEQQPEGKPRCITPISNYATLYMYIYLFLCIKVIEVEWNLRCITLSYHEFYTSIGPTIDMRC